jgi:hypothetical protein
MGLIGLELLVADGRALDVENDAQVFGLFLVDDLPQGAEEAVDGARRETGRIRETLDGVVGAVEEGVAIDEEEPFRTQANLP